VPHWLDLSGYRRSDGRVRFGEECGTCGGEDSCTQSFGGGNLSDKRPLGRFGGRKNDGIKFSLNKERITS
jgi:hypothetical protein